MRRVLASAAAAVFLAVMPASGAVAATAAPTRSCAAVTTRHLTTVTVTGLCPPRVRVQLARPLVVVGWDGEVPIVVHDVPVAAARAHHGRVTFTGLSLGVQYEWRTVRGRHVSGWTLVSA